jgi:hypothetical protein
MIEIYIHELGSEHCDDLLLAYCRDVRNGSSQPAVKLLQNKKFVLTVLLYLTNLIPSLISSFVIPAMLSCALIAPVKL